MTLFITSSCQVFKSVQADGESNKDAETVGSHGRIRPHSIREASRPTQ